MKVVVFGGSGFLGSHVADELSKRGFETTIFDIKPSKYLRDDQKMIKGDILDLKEVKKVVEGKDYIFHFAGIADIDQAKNNPLETIKYNIIGTTNILEACRIFPIKRFLFASTVYVYSKQGAFYRATKQACELIIENYHKIFNIEYTILRYGSLYGPRANSFNFIYNSIYSALTQKKIIRKGDGNEIRDYIHVKDAAKISVDVLYDEEFKNSNIMVTGEQTRKVKEILYMIREMLEGEVKIEFVPHLKMEEHYEMTPYVFKPQIAKKIVPKYYHDLGQGLLEVIYEIYEQINKK